MIDAHVHLWQIGRHGCRWPGPDLPALHRDFVAADLSAVIAGIGVDRVILVQSQEDEADTRWLLSTAQAEPRVAGVIGWTDLSADDIGARLDAFAAAGPLVGIRPMVQDLDDNWFDDPVRDAGFALLAARGLVLDALVRPRHLSSLARLAERHPALSIVVDHLAKPSGGRVTTEWHDGMARLAAMPQVGCKLSGLLTELADGEAAAAILPAVAAAVAMFGTNRIIWGSDWPVVTMRSDYADWLAIVRAATATQAHPAIFGDNAARFYGLPAASEPSA